MRRLIWSVIVALAASPVAAQNTIKIGQIEAQTGANAIYGYMSSQGLALAVDQVNKATEADRYTNNKRTIEQTVDGLFQAYQAKNRIMQDYLELMAGA